VTIPGTDLRQLAREPRPLDAVSWFRFERILY
jgi:hypothetical protein